MMADRKYPNEDVGWATRNFLSGRFSNFEWDVRPCYAIGYREIYIYIYIYVYQGYKIGNRIGSVRYVAYSVACLDSVSPASSGVVRLENLVATFSCLAPFRFVLPAFAPFCSDTVSRSHGPSLTFVRRFHGLPVWNVSFFLQVSAARSRVIVRPCAFGE